MNNEHNIQDIYKIAGGQASDDVLPPPLWQGAKSLGNVLILSKSEVFTKRLYNRIQNIYTSCHSV